MARLNKKQNERLKAYLENTDIKQIINEHLHSNGLHDLEMKDISFTPRVVPCHKTPPPPPANMKWVQSFGGGSCIWVLVPVDDEM